MGDVKSWALRELSVPKKASRNVRHSPVSLLDFRKVLPQIIPMSLQIVDTYSFFGVAVMKSNPFVS